MIIEYLNLKVHGENPLIMHQTLESLYSIFNKVPNLKKIENLQVFVGGSSFLRDELRKELTEDALRFVSSELQVEGMSLSFNDSGKEIVLVNLADLYDFRDEGDVKAFTGVLAHEMIHSFQRQIGLEETIHEAFKQTYPIIEAIKREEECTDKKCIYALDSFAKSVLLSLKEIVCNTYMIDSGLAEESVQSQVKDFQVGRARPEPHFFRVRKGVKPSKRDVPRIVKSVEFEVLILPSWLPITKYSSREAQKLIDYIDRYYQSSTRNIALELMLIEPLYMYNFSYSFSFFSKYFYFLYSTLYEIITGKPFYVLHIAEALKNLEKENMRQREAVEDVLLKSTHLYLKVEEGSKHPEELKVVEDLLKQRLTVREWEEWLNLMNQYKPTELLKLPMLILIDEGINKILRNEKTSFIQVALSLALVGTHTSNEVLFEKIVSDLKLGRLPKNIWDVGKNLYTAYIRLKREIHGLKIDAWEVKRLFKQLRKHGIIPKPEYVNFCLDLMEEAKNELGKDFVFKVENLISKYRVEDESIPLVSASLLAVKRKLGEIREVNKEIMKLYRESP